MVNLSIAKEKISKLENFRPPPNRLKFYVVNLLHSDIGFFSSWKRHYKNIFSSCWFFHQALLSPMVNHVQNFRSICNFWDFLALSEFLFSKYSAIVSVLACSFIINLKSKIVPQLFFLPWKSPEFSIYNFQYSGDNLGL